MKDNVSLNIALRQMCPNAELFLVGIFLYLDWIRRFTEYIPVFRPNTGKYGPEITAYLVTFCAVIDSLISYNVEYIRD